MVILMLLSEIFRRIRELDYKPPITLALLATNILLHIYPQLVYPYLDLSLFSICLRPTTIVDLLTEALTPSQASVWSNPSWSSFLKKATKVLNPTRRWEWLERLLGSAFVHADDTHLYYNMLSLLWKGIQLEASMGSQGFAMLVLFSLVVSHVLVVVLAMVLWQTGLYAGSAHTCMVGFSCVLFSIKYVLNHQSPGSSTIYGLVIPTKYLAWAELVVVSVVTPQASFIGHFCGILAGVLYVHGPKLRLLPSFGRRRYTYHSGTTSGSTTSTSTWRREEKEEDPEVVEAIRRSLLETSTGTGTGTGGGRRRSREEEEDQQVREALRRSMLETTTTSTSSSSGVSPPPPLGAEELRRRRLQTLGGGL